MATAQSKHTERTAPGAALADLQQVNTPTDPARDAAATTTYARELGICSTCMHQPRCLFVKAARKPIQFCEEFDNNADGVNDAGARPVKLRHVETAGQAVDPGICVNCDDRLICMHRTPEAPVYTCEDYSQLT